MSIYLELLLTYVFFLVLAFFYRGPGLQGNVDKILSIATFLFAIDLGFSTANRKSRLDSIRSLLRKNDGTILEIYEMSKNINKKVNDKIRGLLDELLIAQIDYKLVDFEKTEPQLIKLVEYIDTIDAKDDPGEYKARLIDKGQELIDTQKQLVYWLKDKMMLFEWISLLIFAAIMIYCVFAISNGSLLTTIVLPMAGTAMVLLLYVVRDIDNLSWQEGAWIWNRLIELFKELDLPPYILNVLFTQNRIKKNKLELPNEYRLVEYSHPYPDFSDKKVTLVKN